MLSREGAQTSHTGPHMQGHSSCGGGGLLHDYYRYTDVSHRFIIIVEIVDDAQSQAHPLLLLKKYNSIFMSFSGGTGSLVFCLL